MYVGRILPLFFIGVLAIFFTRDAAAAIPAFVQANMQLLYTTKSCDVSTNVQGTTCTPTTVTRSDTYVVQSVQYAAGGSIVVQVSGTPSTCVDGTRCSGFTQFWIDLANPVYLDKLSGTSLTKAASCDSGVVCLQAAGSPGTISSISGRFDAKTGLLLSYQYTQFTPSNTGAPGTSTTTSITIAAPFPLSVVNGGNGT